MDSYWTDTPRISTEFAYRDIDAALMENAALRVMVLPGKGGDIIEFRDKRADVDVLWHADHNWQSPTEGFAPPGPMEEWMAFWPGGWQMNLPLAGWGGSVSDVEYGLHGESALIPWDAAVSRDDDEAVALTLTTELVGYPFAVERVLTLPAGEAGLRIEQAVTNRGEVALEYIWQEHVAIGPPLIGPDARLDVPARTGVVEETYGSEMFETARLADDAAGETFDWPEAPREGGGTVDLREFPPYDAEYHDQVYATDLEAGWYAVTNPALDLGFGLRFPTDPLESLWYWQALGGVQGTPFFNRNYTVGLEPTTGHPGNPETQRANGTMKTLGPGETVSATLTAVTYRGLDAVTAIDDDGTVRGD